MSYELPIIASRLYDVPEAVKDMKTGILIENPPKLAAYKWDGSPNHNDPNFMAVVRRFREDRVKQLAQKTSLLIENASLRRSMGREGRASVEAGEFSIRSRNEKLKRIFDEATANN